MRFLLSLAMLVLSYTTFAASAKIFGEIKGAASEHLQCMIVSNELNVRPVSLTIPLRDGRFSHTFDCSEATFLSFSDGTNYFGGFVEPGDSACVAYDARDFSGSVSYKGRGAAKFEIAWAISQLKSIPTHYQAVARASRFPIDYLFAMIDSVKSSIYLRIRLSVSDIDSPGAHRMRGSLAAAELTARQNSLVAAFGDSYSGILKTHQHALSANSIARMQDLVKFDTTYADSKAYIEAVELFATTYLEENTQQEAVSFPEQRYTLLTDMLPENLRAPVLFRAMVSDLTHRAGYIDEHVFREAAGRLRNVQWRKYILDMLSDTKRLKPGDAAPEFTLQNIDKEIINLASFRGKTVYMDFWFSACGPCHTLFKAIEPVKKQFAHDARVVFLTISIDSEAVWRRAVDRFGLTGYHAFTENKLREHPIIRSYQVAAYPTTFLIDPDGRFFSVRPSQNPESLAKQIRESLRAGKKRQN